MHKKIIIERDCESYIISIDGKAVSFASMITNNFFKLQFDFFETNNSEQKVLYLEETRFLRKNRRTLIFKSDGSTTNKKITQHIGCYKVEVNHNVYEIRYKFIGAPKFYFNNNLVGTIKIIKTSISKYIKEISLEMEFPLVEFNPIIFVYMYIPIDFFDVN